MTEAEKKNFLPQQQQQQLEGQAAVTLHAEEDDELEGEEAEEEEEEQTFTELKDDFRRYQLIQFMQYSNKLYRILHYLDTCRHLLADFVATFGLGPKEIAIYRSNFEHRPNWAYYVTRDILNQSTRADISTMTLNKFVALLAKVPETKIIRQGIHNGQDDILREFEARALLKITAVLIYRRVQGANLDSIAIFKRQLVDNNFQAVDIYDIEPARQETELKTADAVFIVFDDKLNDIFDETLPYAPPANDLDFRHLGRMLYHDFLVNDCRNERIYLFLTPEMNTVLHQSFKFPWLLRENNLNFANDQELINRPHANRVRTYKKPPVLPEDPGYLNEVDGEARTNIGTLLSRLYQNHNRPNRTFR